MVTPYEYIVRAQALFSQGFSVKEVLSQFTDEGKKIGLNTLYQIRRGEFKPAKKGKNAWYLAGEGARGKELEAKVQEQIEKIRADIVTRTTVLEESADVELLKRVNSDKVQDISAGELTKIADSAAKRRALAQGKPTDIFKIFDDEFNNDDIIELTTSDITEAQRVEANPGGPREITQGSQPLPADQSV